MEKLRKYRLVILGLIYLSFAFTFVIPYSQVSRLIVHHQNMSLDQLNPLGSIEVSNSFYIPGKESKSVKTSVLVLTQSLSHSLCNNLNNNILYQVTKHNSNLLPGIFMHVSTYLKVRLLRI